MLKTRPPAWTLTLALLAGGTLPLVQANAQNSSPPELFGDFRQVLPRGRIASVDEPRFVAAGEAKLPDDAWVLGVVLNGEARAYSLNLLNRHEVVNDSIGDAVFAAVW